MNRARRINIHAIPRSWEWCVVLMTFAASLLLIGLRPATMWAATAWWHASHTSAFTEGPVTLNVLLRWYERPGGFLRAPDLGQPENWMYISGRGGCLGAHETSRSKTMLSESQNEAGTHTSPQIAGVRADCWQQSYSGLSGFLSLKRSVPERASTFVVVGHQAALREALQMWKNANWVEKCP
jgi:hypothetical protein